jgi:predicted LPLAT superfamily acyltransferase
MTASLIGPGTADAWTAAPERGTDGALRLMLWILRRLGWRAGHFLLYPIAAYFLLSSPRQRRNARAYLRRALGREPRLLDLYRLWFAFSSTILDRVFLASGRTEGYRFDIEGLDALKAVLAEGRGCLLFGAHMGSFEALRAVADAGSPVELAVLMHEANARRAQSLANAFGGARGHAAAVIPLGTTDAMLRAHEVLGRGGMVGLLADRRPHGERVARVPFLGAPAPLPLGPHLLAMMLGAPVMLAFGLWQGPRRYLVRFEPFPAPASPSRRDRAAEAAESAARFAARLEEICRAHPYNWFNFHDFWNEAPR